MQNKEISLSKFYMIPFTIVMKSLQDFGKVFLIVLD